MILDVVAVTRPAQHPAGQGGSPNAVFFVVGGIILLAVVLTVVVNVRRRRE